MASMCAQKFYEKISHKASKKLFCVTLIDFYLDIAWIDLRLPLSTFLWLNLWSFNQEVINKKIYAFL